ncbi:MAG: hypothetical protein K8I82_14115, partial [Anaerolineae bacterium]|nr:hypothetical protein [Anaerolineae bacterium]
MVLDAQQQQITLWAISLLDVVKDGLAPFVIGQFKQKYQNGYMNHLRTELETPSKTFPEDTYQNEDILRKTVPVDAWLSLMYRRWEAVFTRRLGSAGRKNV